MIKLFILIFGLFFWTCEDETKELIIDDKGNAQFSSHTEKFGKAIAIYVIE